MKLFQIDPALLNDPTVRDIARRLANELANDRSVGQVRIDGSWLRIGDKLRVEHGARRFDADVATAFTARQLEHVKAQTYDVKKAALKARTFLPVSHEAHTGSQVISYDQWDAWGEAELADSYSKDAPRVDAEKRNFPAKVAGLRISYGYDIQDLRAAAMSGSDLKAARAVQARRGMESKFDRIAAKGDVKLGRKGFVNDTSVPTFAGGALSWAFATPSQTIFRALNAIAAQVVVQTNQVEAPDTILFPTKAFQIVTGNTFGDDTAETILSAWLRNNPYGVKFADQWTELDGAGSGGADRIVCYHRDPAVVEIEVSQEYEEFPPEMRGLEFLTQCHMRTAGTVIRYPKAMVYADGAFDVTDFDVTP